MRKAIRKSTKTARLFVALTVLSSLAGRTSLAGDDDPLFITQSVAIARKLIINPAQDLVKDGKILDSDDSLALQKQGEDLSLLDPAPTDVWGGDLKAREIVYPKESVDGWIALKFDSLVTSPRGLARSRVVTDDAQAAPFRMVMSWNLHSALMNAELLRQLGYTVDLPRRYAKARVRFDDLVSRNAFLDAVSGGTGSLIEQWEITPPKDNDLTVEMRDFALEPARIATPPYYWGAIGPTEMQDRRVIRALLVPIVLTSIPDSINLWTWEVGKLVNERVLLYHPFAGNFQGQLNVEDARWIARKICAIPEGDLRRIVDAGGYPTSIDPLLYEKLKARRNHLMDLFEVPCAKLPVNPSLSFPDPETGKPLVQNGKLLRAQFPGYGFSFIGRDPDSPLRKDEMFRYLKLRGIGTALTAGLDELNGKLLKYDGSDASESRGENWAFQGGPGARLNLSASRKLVSGTYYGSESQVQLLDQVSLSASLGYFIAIEQRQLRNVDFRVLPKVGLSRSYLHVKPMTSIEEAQKTPWKDLPVIPKMRSLAKLFDAATEDDRESALNSFLDDFLPGENFTIVDSLDLGAEVSAAVPLPPMALPVVGTGKLTAAAGYDHVILRRTMFQRQADGTLQVTLQRVKENVVDFSLGYSLLVNIASFTAVATNADAKALVFVLDPNAIDAKKELNESLRALLMNNDSGPLERNFQGYDLEHDLKGRTRRLKLLPWSFAHYHEEHLLEAYAPGSPHDAEHRRDLLSFRDRSLSGSDPLGFGSKTAGKVLKELLLPNLDADLGDGAAEAQLDPSASFLGKSHWHEVRLESELTPARNSRTLLTMQETYSGWTMTRDRMLRIMRRLEAQAHDVTEKSPSLIHEEEFLSTSKLLLYQITSSLQIAGPALDAITEIASKSRDDTEFGDALVAAGRLAPVDPNDPTRDYRWVTDLYYDLRRTPALGKTTEENKARLKSLYAGAKTLEREAEPKAIIRLFGEENCLFQIAVTGFRKSDENGDSAYLSASIGQTNPKVGLGAFALFASEQAISPFEVRGVYLGNGL